MAAISGLLVANRAEIAIRVARAAAGLGMRAVMVHSEDDADSLHTRSGDDVQALKGVGAAAYLDMEGVVVAALQAGCDAVHPGYGFLAENAEFARRCGAAGLVFVGPTPETLAMFGDKTAARRLAAECGVPVLAGTAGPTTLADAQAFLAGLGEGAAAMVKAVAGGGGRGIRVVSSSAELDAAFERCRSEALAAFGVGELYVEQYLPRARHVEVQVVGDRTGAVWHLGERECTLQRRHQKVVEIAPCPSLAPGVREALAKSAVRMAESVRYANVGTFEFLLPASGEGFWFIEANARLQVEHTVTEETTGVDIVQAQLRLAGGATLAELGLDAASAPTPRGFAIQVRVNAETMTADGNTRPAGGTLRVFEPPCGPGVRVDTYGYAGYRTNPRFDSLLAKVIIRSGSPRYSDAVAAAYRALGEFRIEGVATNLDLLQSLLSHPEVVANQVHTGFLEDNLGELLSASAHRRRYVETAPGARPGGPGLAGARIDTADPLAVLAHGKRADIVAPQAGDGLLGAPEGVVAVLAPMQGTLVSVDVSEGDKVRAGQGLFIMEAMKMEHVIAAAASGVVRRVEVDKGDAVYEGHVLAYVETGEVAEADDRAALEVDLNHIRSDLADLNARKLLTLDEARPDAVARRRKTNQRTTRENVDQLCDDGSFVEYGALAIAAQRRRRTLDDLIHRTPADGMVTGIGKVNGAECVVMAYDYTVLAGTQGLQNHRKKDRMFELAAQHRLPVVIFTEGGGGRPGDTDGLGSAGLDCWAFNFFGRLSGLVPLVGVNSGRCFAGNAALLGCCDVVIATKNSSIGMGGPAMIEGGGLGIFHPEEVGPMDVQVTNGVVDIAVEDEVEAVEVAKRYLSYFQGPSDAWACADQRLLRSAIPENRLRAYDVRKVITTLADTGSVLELRRNFGHGMVTALARVEGRPIGVVSNNPTHLAGAIDSDGADKAARFLQLCDAFAIPVLFLCDTPGMMVGPEVEKTALVRHCSRLFVVGANLSVPFFTIVLRKGYGLGAQAMAGGSFKAPMFTVAWPTGEFGGMGLEGAVKLGYRNELAALEDPAERKALFDQMVARMYEHGKALSSGSYFEIDDVIDPMESRRWILNALRSAPPPERHGGKRRPCVDTW